MRIATIEDAQAICDYWNNNLDAISAIWATEAIVPLQLDIYLREGICVFGENEGMMCSLPTIEDGKSAWHIGMWWFSSMDKLKEGFELFTQVALDDGSKETICGTINKDTAGDAWALSKGISYTDLPDGKRHYHDEIQVMYDKIRNG